MQNAFTLRFERSATVNTAVLQLVVLQGWINYPVNPVLHRLDGPSISPPEFNVFFGLEDLQLFFQL